MTVLPLNGLPGVLRIPLPTPFAVGTVNAYLLEDDPLTLIDTGPNWSASLVALELALAARGHHVEDLELILLTHQHVDHVGLAQILKRRSRAQVAAVEPVAQHLAAHPDSLAREHEFQIAVMRRYGLGEKRILEAAAISQQYWRYGDTIDVDRVLKPGTHVQLAHRRLEVLLRPGHSPADTVFALDDRSAAFVGDHVLGTISANPLIHEPSDGSSDPADRERPLIAYLESLKRTREDGFGVLLTGHGDVVFDPAALIGERIAGHLERRVTVFDLIREGIRKSEEIIAALWPNLEASQTFLALSEVLGHTDLLIAEGVIAESGESGAITFVESGD